MLETWALEVMEKRRGSDSLRLFLQGVSYLYQGLAWVHRFVQRLFKPTKLSIPVISVGNFVAGGSGKTPVVSYLAKELCNVGKVAILTRGYRRKGKDLLLVSETTPVANSGDEPALLYKWEKRALVFCGKDRAFSGGLAQKVGSDVIVMDDGFQYNKLKKDIEIVTVSAHNPFGYGYHLPRGLLRQSPLSLKRADLVLITGVKDDEQFNLLKKKLRIFTRAPITGMKTQVENQEKIEGKRVGAFCAIAQPSRFRKTLEDLGCEVVSFFTKEDHRAFSKTELEDLAQGAIGAQMLVCTEKDQIKLPSNLALSLPVESVEITSIPYWEARHLKHLIDGVKS